jgi:hypothetical protein
MRRRRSSATQWLGCSEDFVRRVGKMLNVDVDVELGM